jgi:hypothetical protein
MAPRDEMLMTFGASAHAEVSPLAQGGCRATAWRIDGGVVVREADSADLWLLVAVAMIAMLFFIGMLMPGGVG